MRRGKGWKYYLKFYFMVTTVYFVYVSIIAWREGAYQPYSISTVIFLPPIFVGFVAIFDRLLDPLFRKMAGKKKLEKNDYATWVHNMDLLIHDTCSFSIEDYRRLRENARFQKALQQVHRIVTEGETVDLSFAYLQKKFKVGTNEYVALQVVLEEVQKTLENK